MTRVGADPSAASSRTDDDLALAQRALRHVSGEAQVTVRREASLTSRFARSAATQVTAVQDLEIEFLCVIDGHTAAATTGSRDDEELAATARRARAAAEAVARSEDAPGPYPGLPSPGPPPEPVGFDALTARLDPAAAGTALQATFDEAAASGLEAFGIWTAGASGTAIASTAGVAAGETVTDAHMRVILRDDHGRSGFAAHTAPAFAGIDGRALAARAAAKVDARDPVELAPGEYTVVLESEAVDTLLDFLGHLAFNGLAHAEGRGALAGRLGTSVASSAIDLSDSPRSDATLARSFDSEGVAKAPLALIEKGVARAVVHDTRSAAHAGGDARSTGHALAAGGAPGGPLPTNLVLGGGDCADELDLAAPVERGLYVTRLWYVNTVRDRETLLTGTTRDGTFLIEDGRLAAPVRDVRFTDSALRILSATEALSATTRLCSEADLYGLRFVYGSVCPALRAAGFRITGASVA